MLSIIQCASKILSSSSIAWPPSPPPVYVRVIPVCPADPRGKYTLNESHSLTPTICRLCFIKQNVALDEHVMCIFYYRLKLYYSYRMCPCVNGSSGNVCERERARGCKQKKACEFVYFAVFEKKKRKTRSTLLGIFEIKTKRRHTVRTNKSEIHYLSKQIKLSNRQSNRENV